MTSTPPPEPLMVDSGTDCHVTPPEIADRMVDYAGMEGEHRVLEPSAGTGNLIQAVLDNGHPLERMTAIEQHYKLCETLKNRFPDLSVLQQDFLEYRVYGQYDRILMNPPYSKRRAYQHVEQARKCLAEDGLIIALVPCTFQCEGMEALETLPQGTFASTDVVTKLVEVCS